MKISTNDVYVTLQLSNVNMDLLFPPYIKNPFSVQPKNSWKPGIHMDNAAAPMLVIL